VSRNKLFLVSLAGVFMLAESLYAEDPVKTISVAFRGYCDGATITYSSKSSFISGTHDNWDCKGGQTWIDGVLSEPVNLLSNEGIGPVVLADNVGVLGMNNSALQLYLNFFNYTFSFYVESDGVLPERLVTKGHFRIVGGAVTSGPNGAAWQDPPTWDTDRPHADPRFPKGTYDLELYDTTDTLQYCDFFHVTADGDRVGGVHDFMTACEYSANAPTGGNYAILEKDVVVLTQANGGVVGVEGPSLLTTDNIEQILSGYDYTLNYYFDFPKKAWSLYGTDGTTGLQLLNWGFFTLVPDDPLAAKAVTHSGGGIPTTSPLPR
jgi:hypothetical protein